MGSTRSFVRGLTIGAGAMYLLDPEHGKVRREHLVRRANQLLYGASAIDEGAPQGQVEVGHYGARVGDIAGLDAASLGRHRAFADGGSGKDMALKVLGGLLALYGLTRRGGIASLFRTVGTGLLVGSAGGGTLGGVLPSYGDRRRAVDIQKTLQ